MKSELSDYGNLYKVKLPPKLDVEFLFDKVHKPIYCILPCRPATPEVGIKFITGFHNYTGVPRWPKQLNFHKELSNVLFLE